MFSILTLWNIYGGVMLIHGGFVAYSFMKWLAWPFQWLIPKPLPQIEDYHIV